MKKNLLFIFFTYVFLLPNNVISQNFQNQNNSCSNEHEYVFDLDYNRILYKKNTIVKINSSYSLVWAKKYNGLTFKKLLSSKTGSIYFIASHNATPYSTNYFGKINPDGNIAWCKVIPTADLPWFDLYAMMLDRNGDLVLTSSTSNNMFFKTDTLGNLLKIRAFNNNGRNELSALTLISDSAGIYTFAGYGYIFENYGGTILKYSDGNDNVISSKEFGNYYGQTGTGFNGQYNYKIHKSRNNPLDFYFFVYINPPSWEPNVTLDIFKFRGNQFLWKQKIEDLDIEGVEEDYLKNLNLLASKKNTFNSKKDVFIYRFDSIGNMEANSYNYLRLFSINNIDSLAKDSLLNISTVSGQMFYSSIFTKNYLRISRFAFFTGYTCMPANSIPNYTQLTAYLGDGPMSYTVNTYTSALTDSSAISVTNIPFSVSREDCWLTMSLDEKIEHDKIFNIFPNPVDKYMNFSFQPEIENINHYSLIITDVLGKEVFETSYNNKIDVSNLDNGVYFVKLFDKNKLIQVEKIIIER